MLNCSKNTYSNSWSQGWKEMKTFPSDEVYFISIFPYLIALWISLCKSDTFSYGSSFLIFVNKSNNIYLLFGDTENATTRDQL